MNITMSRWLLPCCALLSFIFTLVPFFISQAGWVNNWSGTALRHLICYLIGFGLLSLFLNQLKTINKRFFLTVACLLYIAMGVGLYELFTASWFVLSLLAIGSIVTYKITKQKNHGFYAEFIIGLGIFIGLFSILVGYNVNYSAVYWAFLILPVFCWVMLFKHNYRDVLAGVFSYFDDFSGVDYWKFSIFLLITTYITSHSFFPTTMWDDHVSHLSLWKKLEVLHVYQPDVVSQIWSVAPFTTDLMHAFISIACGSDARGALNALILVLTVFAVIELAKIFLADINDRVLIAILFVSTPMASNLLLGLQTDLFLSFMVASTTLILFQITKTSRITLICSILIACAVISVIKLPAILFSVGFIGLLVFILIGNKSLIHTIQSHWLALTCFFVVATFIAVYPYLKAYFITGNPVFPLYNGIFKSPYFPTVNFLDERYVKGASFRSYLGMFYDTSTYFESKNYVAGFQYFLLFPVSVVALLFMRVKNVSLLLIPFVIYAIPMFLTLQYVRYFFEVLPLSSIMLGVFLLKSDFKLFNRVIFYLFIFINILFLPGVSWSFSLSPLSMFFNDTKLNYTQQSAPELLLNNEINAVNPAAKVLYDLSRPYGASLAGTPFYDAWYSPKNFSEISTWTSLDILKQSVKSMGIDYIYWNQAVPYTKSAIKRKFLNEYLNSYGAPKYQQGPIVAYQVSDSVVDYQSILTINIFDSLSSFNVSGSPVITDGQLVVSPVNIVTKQINVLAYSAFKYSIKINCANPVDEFIAQINWDKGQPFYKIIQCNVEPFDYTETGVIPEGAKYGMLYLSARSGTANIHAVNIGVK